MDADRMHATSSRQSPSRHFKSTEDFALKARFDEVVGRFAGAPTSQLDVPISNWAVASDRRLPFALLDRTVRELITASFDSLIATPGVGNKKFASLVTLLQRALQASEAPPVRIEPEAVDAIALPHETFDPEQVSQIVWAEWQATVQRHHLHDEPLGRLAASLQSLPTVIWSKPLGDYLRYTIDELRHLKTHGDKRVTAVLEVFHAVHSTLGISGPSPRILAQLTPAFIPPIERWLHAALASDEPPRVQDIRQHLVLPLLNQIERDAGETVHRLAAGRLGIESFPEGVREQSQTLGVSRARIYQLLETCGDVMRIRWPAGRWMFELLLQKLQVQAGEVEALDLLESVNWLLYPKRRMNLATEPAIA